MELEYHEYEDKINIEHRIDQIEEKLSVIINKLEKIETSNVKLEEHIDFINSVYLRVQRPLYWICDKINYIKGQKIENTTGELLNKSNIDEQD